MMIIKKAVVCDSPKCDASVLPDKNEDTTGWSYIEGILWTKDTPSDVTASTYHFCCGNCRSTAKEAWSDRIGSRQVFQPVDGSRW